jgi:hypothetical protein
MSLTLDIENELKALINPALSVLSSGNIAVYTSQEAYKEALDLTVLIAYRSSLWTNPALCYGNKRTMTFVVEVAGTNEALVQEGLVVIRGAINGNPLVTHADLTAPLIQEELVERTKDTGLIVVQQIYQIDFVGVE